MAARSSNDSERTGELPSSVVSDLLSADHRRIALEVLRDRDQPVVVSELAAEILAIERETSPSEISETDRDELRKEFYSDHLPKLTATGVVDYDSMTETVDLRRPEILESGTE